MQDTGQSRSNEVNRRTVVAGVAVMATGSAADNAECAELFVNGGAHLVVPDFVTVLETGGSLFPMVEQVRRATAWAYKNAASFGGDPNRIYVAGRSSGAHLAGTVLITDW